MNHNESGNETLAESKQITQHNFSEGQKPIVTVRIATYMHEAYIKECIEGVLMQRTTFPVQIIVHDDASTDKTPSIIKEYEKKFPYLFTNIYQTENQYSKHGGKAVIDAMNKYTQGKYIAICEGDDYWTCPDKLQKQVNFLEANPEFALCFHNSEIIHGHKKTKKKYNFANFAKSIYTINDIIEKQWFIPTQSIVYRKEMNTMQKWSNYISNGDFALQLILAEKGPFFCVNETMSVYRKHPTSMNATHKRDFFSFKIIQILLYFDYYSEFKYNKIIWNRIEEIKSSVYKKNLYDRPLISRLFSIDYYIFKLKSAFKK